MKSASRLGKMEDIGTLIAHSNLINDFEPSITDIK